MANPIHCDPRTLLKQLAIPLVQRLFEQRGELLDLPWSEIRQKKQTAPIYAAWQRLPEDRRREVQIVFHEIAEAATELGIAAFAQEVKHAAPGDVWKFTACRSRLNKALWFYLSFPELFERATLADSLPSRSRTPRGQSYSSAILRLRTTPGPAERRPLCGCRRFRLWERTGWKSTATPCWRRSCWPTQLAQQPTTTKPNHPR